MRGLSDGGGPDWGEGPKSLWAKPPMGPAPRSDDRARVIPRVRYAFMVAFACSAVSLSAFHGPAMDPAQWDGNHDAAMAAARRETRASVLYFTAPLDAVSHETFIRLKTDPVLVDAMDRMVRVILEQPDLGIAHGRYRVTELPALAVLDPGGALVDLVVVTPHSDKWVGRFLDACEEAHARTAAWVRHPPPALPREPGPDECEVECRPRPRCALPDKAPARAPRVAKPVGASVKSALSRYFARRGGLSPVEGAVELPQMAKPDRRARPAQLPARSPSAAPRSALEGDVGSEVDASPGATRRTIEAAFADRALQAARSVTR